MTHQDLQSNVATVEPASLPERRAGRASTLVNWVLAVLTVPAAIVVMFSAIGGVMSTAGCTGQSCTGPSSSWFGVLFYGAPVVAVLTIISSFFTARRRWGLAVPLCALALLAVDGLVLAMSF